MTDTDLLNSACPLCGAHIPVGIEDCQALFNAIVAWEYSNPAYAGVHLLVVDSYVLQHSEEHSPRSNAYHMMSLCWMLEHGGSTAPGGSSPRDRQQFEAAYREFPFLAPPADRGQITVADVYKTSDAASFKQLVREWAQSVWDAWSEHHAWARQEVRKLM